MVRTGLGKKCRVWQPDGEAQALSGFRALGWLFIERARVEGETNAAAALEVCVEAFRFDEEFARGGPVINHLVGWGCQMVVLREAAKYVPRTSPGECPRIVRSLRKIEQDAATWEKIVTDEQLWWDTRAGLREKIVRIVDRKSVDAVMAKSKAVRDRAAAGFKAFIATLDARAREVDAPVIAREMKTNH